MNINKPFRHFIRLNRRNFTFGISALLLTNIFDGLTPLMLKYAIDDFVANKPLSDLTPILLIFLGLILGTALCRFLWRIFFGRFHHTVAEDLRNLIFNKFTAMGPSFFQKRPVGELMSLITNDVNYFRQAIGPGVLVLFDSLFIMLTVVPIMFYLSVSWTVKALICLSILPFVIHKIEAAIERAFKKKQDKFAEVSGVAQEIVSGVRIIKGFAQENNHTDFFNVSSKEYEEASNKAARIHALFGPVMQLGVVTAGFILLVVSAPDVLAGVATIGTFVAFFRYIQKMTWPMTAIGMGVSMVQEGRASFRRISEILTAPIDVPDNGSLRPLEFESLEVRNLSFNYPGTKQKILQNISFRLDAGKTLGILGPVGSGKTTLVNLICLLYKIDPKTVFINGHPIENIKRDCLRELITLVPQNHFLFGDSIRNNLMFGLKEGASQEDIEAIAQLVSLHDEILNAPSGYETILGEKGVNLSGGQKQRMTIGRGLIRNSPLLILDDVLSAVDAQSETKILSNLHRDIDEPKKAKQTRIIISHRLASLIKADNIIVLNNGQIEAQGTHEELLAKSHTYISTFDLQYKDTQSRKSNSFVEERI